MVAPVRHPTQFVPVPMFVSFDQVQQQLGLDVITNAVSDLNAQGPVRDAQIQSLATQDAEILRRINELETRHLPGHPLPLPCNALQILPAYAEALRCAGIHSAEEIAAMDNPERLIKALREVMSDAQDARRAAVCIWEGSKLGHHTPKADGYDPKPTTPSKQKQEPETKPPPNPRPRAAK